MIVIAERSLQTVLNQAFTLFRQNLSTFVPDVFAQETSEHQQEITNWWSNAKNQVPVIIGYSLQPIQSQQVAITTEPSEENSTMRAIGNAASAEQYATTFNANYALHAFGINQNWILWLQTLIKWALEINRFSLEQDYELINQLIRLSGIRPAPDSLKDSVFPYMRTVSLSCQHTDTWTPLPVSTFKSATVNLEPTYTELGG